jgi:hypothetical protein
MNSDFLFATPSLLSGIGRAFDLWGCFADSNDSPSGDLADERGLYADWRMVGEDLATAIEREGERINA